MYFKIIYFLCIFIFFACDKKKYDDYNPLNPSDCTFEDITGMCCNEEDLDCNDICYGNSAINCNNECVSIA